MSETTAPITDVSLLVEAAKTDTIYRDVYLRRARELLSAMLDEASYRALGSTQKQIDEVVRRTRSAVLQHDWAEAGELAAQAEQMRKHSHALADLAGLARMSTIPTLSLSILFHRASISASERRACKANYTRGSW